MQLYEIHILDNKLNFTPADHCKNNIICVSIYIILYRSGAIMNWMFHSMLFTTANNIFIRSYLGHGLMYSIVMKSSWLPFYKNIALTIYN